MEDGVALGAVAVAVDGDSDGEVVGSADGDCGSWSQLHVGVCRSDSNDFTYDKASGTLKSNLCPLKCVGSGASGSVALVLCSAAGAGGWAEVP